MKSLERDRKILHDITYMWDLNITQINLSTKQKRPTDTQNRLMVTGVGEMGEGCTGSWV